MASAPIAFQSNPGRYNFEGVTQLVNAYAEKRGDDAKGPLSVLPADGIAELTDEGEGPCRGLIFMEDLDKVYAFHPSSVYRLTNAAGVVTATRIGTIPGNDQVELSRNQKSDPQLMVRTDSGVQVVESDAASYVLDEDLPDEVVSVTVASGYAAYGEANGKFTLSSLNDAKIIDPLDFATFEQRSDKLVRMREHAGELLGFKTRSLEFWRNVNDPDFPFSPIGFKSRGLLSADGLVESDNTLMFPGDDGIVYRLNNYDPARISNHHVERLIQADTDQANILGFSWSRGGHAFANWTGTDWSRCYDAVTGTWHSRQSYGQNTWRARHSIQAWGRTIVGDALSGKIGYLDSNTYTEYGEVMVWKVVSPPMHTFPNGAIVDAFHMDLGTGYGTLTGQGSEPKVMLRVSKDGGNTFGSYRELELGIRGDHATRVTARRLGKFGPKGIVFEISISDPVVRALVSTDIEIRPLKR
jgi:hypothetical protein